jgi:hypothetical protein
MPVQARRNVVLAATSTTSHAASNAHTAPDRHAVGDPEDGDLDPREAGDRVVEARGEVAQQSRAIRYARIHKHVNVGAEAEILPFAAQHHGTNPVLGGKLTGCVGELG